MLSDDLREELAAIAPAQRVRPARRALRPLPRRRPRASPRPRQRRRPPRRLELDGRPPRVRAPARGRASRPRSAPTRAAPSTKRRATSSTWRARRRHTRRCTGPAFSTARTDRSAARHSASSLGAAARPPTSAARCSARARSAGREARTSRSAPRRPRERASSPRSRRASAPSCTSRSASSHATAYAKGTEAIADVLVAAGAVDLVLALEEQAVLAATRADANRLANADHANLVRTGRAAHAQLEALRPARRRRAPRRPPRDRAPASAPSDGVDGRARSPLQARPLEGEPPTGDSAVCRSFPGS